MCHSNKTENGDIFHNHVFMIALFFLCVSLFFTPSQQKGLQEQNKQKDLY